MSTHDLRDKLDGINPTNRMDSMYPEAMSRLHRGIGKPTKIEHNPQNYKRKVKKNMDRRGRFRTQPVTFMEIREVDEENPEHAVLTSGARVCRTNNDNSEEENEIDNNVNNNNAAIERLGHIITNTPADLGNANQNNQILLSKHIVDKQETEQKELKTSFEEFSRNFVGYKGTKNKRIASNLPNKDVCSGGPILQLDNMPRIGGTNDVLESVSEERNRAHDNDNIIDSPNNYELEEENQDQVGQLMTQCLNHGIHHHHSGKNTQLLRAQANAPMEFPKGFSAKSRPSL